MSEFGSFIDCSNWWTYNELETTELRVRKVKKERVAVFKLEVNESGYDGAKSGKVESVLILRRSRIDKKQDLETNWGDMIIESVESKITPRLRADWSVVIVTLESIKWEGSEILNSWAGRPIRRNSVLDWLRGDLQKSIERQDQLYCMGV